MTQKKLRIAIQMDPIDSILFKSDSSFLLAFEAQSRGHTLFYYQPWQLSLLNGKVTAKVQPITLRNDEDDYFTLGEEQQMDMATLDVVLMRQDPPFDMRYLTYTYMLDKIHPKTLVLNPPSEVRNCPEKLFVCDFPEFTPPTLISADRDTIRRFAKEQGAIVLKPLYAFGGQDVFKVEDNLEELMEKLLSAYDVPLIAQAFIAGIAKGDKRIMMLNGEPVGALNRIPQEGSIRANLAAGGTSFKTTLTEREKKICAALKPELQKRGLLLAGIDVIDGYLTEINVTSPTGLRAVNRLDGVCVEAMFWDCVEAMRG